MASKNAALIAALTDELARANKRREKQSKQSPRPSGYQHTLKWVELTERKLAAARKGQPDGWRKPRGAAAQKAVGKRPTGNPRAATRRKAAPVTPTPTPATDTAAA